MNLDRMPARFLKIAAFLGCVGAMALAQQGIKFDHLTEKQGLSQNTVICILQDRAGFMWFGTQDGLNRYDGYEFTVFRNDPSDPASLSENFIVFLAEDRSGTLWVGTRSMPEILNRYDPHLESFTRMPRDSVDLAGAQINAARADYEDPAGIRWLGARDGGLTRHDPKTRSAKVFLHDPSNPASIAHNDVFHVVGDPDGSLWVSTSGGLDRFDPKTETFTHFRHDDADARSLSDNETWPLLIDRTGVLWVGTYSGGLNRYDRQTESFTSFRHDESNPRSIAGDRLYALYQDRSGVVWVGTGDHGVDRFHPELAPFVHVGHNPADPSSLSNNNIQSIAIDQRGIAWIGTRSGLNRWDRRSGRFTRYQHNASDPHSLAEDHVAPALLVDRSGLLWIGTSSSGLDRLDPATGRFVHFRHDPANPRSLSNDLVYALCEDRSGDIWIGTYAGGLNRWKRTSGEFVRYPHDGSDSTSLGADGVWALLEDRDGVLWVGTYGGGLDRFDRATGTFVHYRHEDSNPESLSDDIVLCITEDRAANLWIGTTAGVNLLDRQRGTFRHFREKDGLANDVVFGILEDARGNLWMSTNKGISRFDPRTETFRTFDYTDGLQGNEFNQGASAKDPKSGALFFGGPNGFNVFDPAEVRDNPYVPPLVFSSFTRYNTDDKAGRPIAEHGVSAKSEITVSYKDNVIYFEFAALSYHNNFKNHYAYMLEGFSDNWIQLGTERRATFTNLDGGEYVLRVRGSNNDGVWNEEGSALKLIVTPPWWRTTWAYTGYGVLIVALLYGARRFEINQREQKAKMREAQLHAKAVEAEKKVLEAENERKTKELEDARRLQLSMLPKEVPQLSGYEIAVFMKTATEVGGDYYDFSLSKDGTLDVAFGDATGHGMQAGTVVTLMKGLFLLEAARTDIQTFFGHCTRAIKETKLGRLLMAFSLVRIRGNSVSLSAAGMPPVYLHRKRDGSLEEILLKGMPLGAMKNFPYGLHETSLEPGDTLLLLTDGLPEQKNAREEMFDYTRVQKVFSEAIACAPAEVIERLVQAGELWMDGIAQDDDITLMVIRKKT